MSWPVVGSFSFRLIASALRRPSEIPIMSRSRDPAEGAVVQDGSVRRQRARTATLATVACLAVVCAVVVSCQRKLPTAPSDLTLGLVIYEDKNYQGESAHVTEDISDLDGVEGPCIETSYVGGVFSMTYYWDDCISSVRIAPGWEAHLYEHPDFGGWDQIILEDVPDLSKVRGPHDGNLDECVSSIRVFRQE